MGFFLRALGLLAVLAVSLISAWVGSSLASWLGGPRWLAVATALALLPGLALLWERGAVNRRNAAKKKRRVALAATLALRSLVLGAVFLGLLLSWWPNQTFLALAQRGDWFLDGADPSWEPLRPIARGGAQLLEGAWRATVPNPYKKYEQPAPKLAADPKAAEIARAELPMPHQQPVRRGWTTATVDAGTVVAASPRQLCATMEDGSKVCVDEEEPPAFEPPPAQEPPVAAEPTQPTINVPTPQQPGPRGGAARGAEWPLPLELHWAVGLIRPSEETSVAAIAEALKQRSTPGADRVKAVHDWVADRIAYDAVAYQKMSIPPQAPEEVLKRRTAVCAGYALLFEALARAAGEEVITLSGQGRGLNGFESHAWNAVKLNDGWALLDVTWNAGGVTKTEPNWTFTKRYFTGYLFTPPEQFANTHLPTDPRWQLLDKPKTAAEVLAAPAMSVVYHSTGIKLRQPSRAVTETSAGVFEVELENPRRREVMAQVCRDAKCLPCDGGGRGVERLRCHLAASGSWELKLFAADHEPQPGHELVMLPQIATATLQVR